MLDSKTRLKDMGRFSGHKTSRPGHKTGSEPSVLELDH
jgi:hypothetical protein